MMMLSSSRWFSLVPTSTTTGATTTTTQSIKREYLSSPKDRHDDHDRRHGNDEKVKTDVRDDFECLANGTDDKDETLPLSSAEEENGPLVICPCPRLMRRPVSDMLLSALSSREQELYMNDFLPPHANIREASSLRRNGNRQVVLMARDYTSAGSDNEDAEDASECWEV